VAIAVLLALGQNSAQSSFAPYTTIMRLPFEKILMLIL
jgi:hypothetical protein